MLTRLFPYIWSVAIIGIFSIGVASLMYGESLTLAVIAIVGSIVLFAVNKPWKDMK
jgi:hypothetical protein